MSWSRRPQRRLDASTLRRRTGQEEADDPPSLAGRTIFISGASRGIGLAIALRAARDGANVALVAKTAEPHPKLEGTVHTAAAAIEAAGGRRCRSSATSATRTRSQAAVDAAVERFGGIDICVNNASRDQPRPAPRRSSPSATT